MNMSYCRFENTNRDLNDCAEAIEELLNDANTEPLSDTETRAAAALIERCADIIVLVCETLCIEPDDLLDATTPKRVQEFVAYMNRR